MGLGLEQGSIAFKPIGANSAFATGGPIQNGRYALAADRGPAVGDNRVESRATRKTGKQVQAPLGDPGRTTDEIVEAVPARYNQQSTLERSVPSGENQFDFELTTN